MLDAHSKPWMVCMLLGLLAMIPATYNLIVAWQEADNNLTTVVGTLQHVDGRYDSTLYVSNGARSGSCRNCVNPVLKSLVGSLIAADVNAKGQIVSVHTNEATVVLVNSEERHRTWRAQFYFGLSIILITLGIYLFKGRT
jgi:hypothetical protein